MAPSKDQTIDRLTQLLEQQAQQAAQQAEATREQQARQDALIAEQRAMITQLLANQQRAQPQMQQVVNQSAQHETIASSLDNRIGRFNYDPEGGCTFNAWYQRYGKFFEEDGKDLDAATKVRLHVSKLSDKDYSNFADSIQPQQPDDLSFEEAVKQLKELFDDTRSVFVRRYECFKLKQRANQDVMVLFDQVNAACENADFSPCCKEEQKCLILVTALRDDLHELRQKCLQILEDARRKKEDITLKKLREACRTFLSVRTNAALLSQSKTKSIDIDAISAYPEQWKQQKKKKNFNRHDAGGSASTFKPCLSCGQTGHRREDCKFRDATCHQCQKKGHIKAVCQSKAVQEANKTPTATVQTVIVSSTNVQLKDDRYVWKEQVKINNIGCQMKVDTGAGITLLRTNTWRKLGSPKLMPAEIKVKDCTGQEFPLEGSIFCEVQLEDQPVQKLDAYVCSTVTHDLLGVPWIRALNLNLQRWFDAMHKSTTKDVTPVPYSEVNIQEVNVQATSTPNSSVDASSMRHSEHNVQKKAVPRKILRNSNSMYKAGDPVQLLNFNNDKATWIPGTIIERVDGSQRYRVEVPRLGTRVHRYANQLRSQPMTKKQRKSTDVQKHGSTTVSATTCSTIGRATTSATTDHSDGPRSSTSTTTCSTTDHSEEPSSTTTRSDGRHTWTDVIYGTF